jgi:hypothetical protein
MHLLERLPQARHSVAPRPVVSAGLLLLSFYRVAAGSRLSPERALDEPP